MMDRNSALFKTAIVILLLLYLPVTVAAQMPQGEQQNDYMQGYLDGQRDAKASGAWFFAGCCLGVTGLLLAYLMAPSPSTATIMGKSQQYIMGYTEGYKEKARKDQFNKALTGCVVSAVVYIGLYVVLIAIAASEDNDPYYYGY